MKTATIYLILISLLTGCTNKLDKNPSQNSSLNEITAGKEKFVKKEKMGSMQSSLDNWLQNKWTPTVEKNETIKEINSDKDRDFTLQEYVDKASIYIKENNTSDANSHVEKLNSMPVIGH